MTQLQADALKEEDDDAFKDKFNKIYKCIQQRTNLQVQTIY